MPNDEKIQPPLSSDLSKQPTQKLSPVTGEVVGAVSASAALDSDERSQSDGKSFEKQDFGLSEEPKERVEENVVDNTWENAGEKPVSDRPSVNDQKILFGRKKSNKKAKKGKLSEESGAFTQDNSSGNAGFNGNVGDRQEASKLVWSNDNARSNGVAEISSQQNNFSEFSNREDFLQKKPDKYANHKKRKNKRKPVKFKTILKCILTMLVLIIIVLVTYGIWNRWFRYDDAKDLQGTWKIDGSNASFVINDKKIGITADIIMEYSIDTQAKVINYKIGTMTGQSHYRFSDDRKQVALVESGSKDTLSTCLSDFGWLFDSITAKMNGLEITPAYTVKSSDNANTENTGIEDILKNGNQQTVLLDKVS